MTSFNQLLQNLLLTLMFSDHTYTWPDMTQWASRVILTFASAVTKYCAGLKVKERACTHIQFVHICLALWLAVVVGKALSRLFSITGIAEHILVDNIKPFWNCIIIQYWNIMSLYISSSSSAIAVAACVMSLLTTRGRGVDRDAWETTDTKRGITSQSMINAIAVLLCLLSALGVAFGLRLLSLLVNLAAPGLIVYSISMLFGLHMYLAVQGFWPITWLGLVCSCGKRPGGSLPHAEQLKHSLSNFIRTG